MNQDFFDPRSYFAPFTPLGGTYVYASARRSLAPPWAAYIKVAPRVILSPAHPRFGGVGTAEWFGAARGSDPCRAAATRRPSPVCPQRGLPDLIYRMTFG